MEDLVDPRFLNVNARRDELQDDPVLESFCRDAFACGKTSGDPPWVRAAGGVDARCLSFHGVARS
jgi:hypothetical protein